MKTEDFAYVVETGKGFDEAVVSVLKSVEQRGWSLFQVYDVRERLAAKGFSSGRLKIIEMCSAKYASKFLGKNSLASLCMPCKVNVFEEDGRVKIMAMRPSIISTFFPEISESEAAEAEKDVIGIVDGAR